MRKRAERRGFCLVFFVLFKDFLELQSLMSRRGTGGPALAGAFQGQAGTAETERQRALDTASKGLEDRLPAAGTGRPTLQGVLSPLVDVL